jgi:hypothetical protein
MWFKLGVSSGCYDDCEAGHVKELRALGFRFKDRGADGGTLCQVDREHVPEIEIADLAALIAFAGEHGPILIPNAADADTGGPYQIHDGCC